MPFTRREFLERSGMLGASLALPQVGRQPSAPKYKTTFDARSLAQFVDPLPISEVASPAGVRPAPDDARLKIPYYRIGMRQIESKLHRDLKPTRQWAFGTNVPGPSFNVRSGQPVLVEWANELPAKHLFPIDHSIHGAELDKPEVRTVVHLHGGKVPAESDGYPENWFVPGKSAVYYYPNRQEAATLWYHDHALGINRLNVFAGLFGFYLLRDEFEDKLNLPQGKYEIPLAFYDRSFDLDGQLNYPVSGDPKSSWTPEVFGDAIVINGKIFPYLEVEPRKYRFRILNAANGRFFHLWFASNLPLHQIGTDQGLLPAPVELKRVVLAPAERADVVVDFSSLAGEQIALTNDGINVMQFRVGKSRVLDASALPSVLRPMTRTSESDAIKTRNLTLDEVQDPAQRPLRMLLNNAHWDDPITESPTLDSVEIWNLINLTDDSHPIHLHLVRFQILDRRSFDAPTYMRTGQFKAMGPPVLPDASEAGWKDTVRAEPSMVTRIIVRFEGYPGRYVWHCHILEHEDNEMMRPYEVVKR
ncbi:MAG TPA: multicopper oxidase [Candidatus Binatia bacterium]|nr:multicopper oxidase [Candidatus Binatia bacterium]